jgi:imidazoleglycerol-phosphate dehydratase
MRKAVIERKTAETEIFLRINLDGRGKSDIDTGIGFFDHMLVALSRHSFIDIELKAKGDLYVDTHHTVEDTGIVFGNALKEALGDKKGIKRYGSCILPMDEALILSAIDFGGRSYLNYDVNLTVERVGEFECEMLKEFFIAVANNAQMNIHLKQIDGSNNHHIIEAVFKSFAKSLKDAVNIDGKIEGVLSTKGSL